MPIGVYVRSEKQKQKMAEGHRGKRLSEKHRRKIAELKAENDTLFNSGKLNQEDRINRLHIILKLRREETDELVLENQQLKDRIKLLEEQLAGFVKIEPAKVEIPQPKYEKGDRAYLTDGGEWIIESISGFNNADKWVYWIRNYKGGTAIRVKESELIKIGGKL